MLSVLSTDDSSVLRELERQTSLTFRSWRPMSNRLAGLMSHGRHRYTGSTITTSTSSTPRNRRKAFMLTASPKGGTQSLKMMPASVGRTGETERRLLDRRHPGLAGEHGRALRAFQSTWRLCRLEIDDHAMPNYSRSGSLRESQVGRQETRDAENPIPSHNYRSRVWPFPRSTLTRKFCKRNRTVLLNGLAHGKCQRT